MILFSGLILYEGMFSSSSDPKANVIQMKKTKARHNVKTHDALKASIYSLTVPDIDGTPTPLSQYEGFVTLIVNVASAWGKTNISYEQLSSLQHKYGARKFAVLAFPTNDFHQETGTNAEINSFVDLHYPDCGFQIFEKSSLKDSTVYKALSSQVDGKVKGNFYKYLVNRKGEAVSLHGKKDAPFSFEQEIVRLLDEP